MCPYMTGGRSRRGSPKAGTTVVPKAVFNGKDRTSKITDPIP